MDIMDNALQMMREGNKHITLSTNRDLIVSLGLTGSGKSTLSLLLTSDNSKLTSFKMGAGSYLIIDENKKITSPNNSLISQTILPEMMIDPTTGAVFYDMPGFKDTRSSSMEIATTFFMKKVLNHAERIKLIFVVDHNIVLPTSSRTEFPDFLRHATNSIKNVDKFRDSICMVFTKVLNTYEKVNKVLTLVDNEKMIKTVAGYLRTNFAREDERLNEQMIKLVNITLSKQGGKYKRMSLFRSPDEEGPLSNITIIQESKENINRMIHQNLKYTPSTGEDFGYTISERTEMDIYDMLQNVTDNLKEKLTSLMNRMARHLEGEEQNFDIETLSSKYTFAFNRLSQIVENEKNSPASIELFRSIERLMKDLKITELKQDSLDVGRLGENLNLIGVVSPKQNIDRSSRLIMAPVEDKQRQFQNLKNWFAFLVTLEGEISSYERLRNPPKKYNKIKEQLAAVERDKINMIGADLAEFLDEISSGRKYIFGYDLIKEVVINPKRARILTQLLESTLTLTPTFTCYNSDKLRITALYLKLKETLAFTCPSGIRTMEIFVGKKLWIDTDFIRPERNMNLVIVSPTWEVPGQRMIHLEGYLGPSHSNLVAADGFKATQRWESNGDGNNGGDGADGLSGLPGGNGGNFYGIAHEIVNGDKLIISVNGGQGGPGQNGGNGGDGASGEDADRTSDKFRQGTDTRWEFLDHITIHTYYGGKGGRGGHGGRGGGGGLGGYAGNVRILELKNPGHTITSTIDGSVGSNGNPGLGGLSGMPGKNCDSEYRSTISLDDDDDFPDVREDPPCSHEDTFSPERNEVYRGLNYQGQNSPMAKSNPKFEYVLPEYKSYVKKLREQPYLVKFPTTLIDLPDNYGIRNRRDIHEIPSVQTNRYSLGDIANSSLYLLDVIARKCTNVKYKHWYKSSNDIEHFVHPIKLTVRFEELLSELLGNDIKVFDPSSMIEKLNLLMRKNNCYDKIYQFMYDRMRDFDWGSKIPDDYLKKRVEQLLEE